ncbi:MAG: DUF3025 domain-containing protein [Pseudomonadota bacterium]
MQKLSDWDREALLSSPLLKPLHGVIERLAKDDFPTLEQLNVLLAARSAPIETESGQLLRFVSQRHGMLPPEQQYEPLCYLTGGVQTREKNWHDFFNALIWMCYPSAKAAINARHFNVLKHGAAVGNTGTSGRGGVRDMCTLLDESGVLVASAEGELSGMLQNFQWKELFWERRTVLPKSMQFFIFGHGLCEKALHPYLGVTGQGLILPVDAQFFGWTEPDKCAYLDRRLADYIANPAHCLSTKELTPVPLLGYPGWFTGNEREAFFDNTDYFRPDRRNRRES